MALLAAGGLAGETLGTTVIALVALLTFLAAGAAVVAAYWRSGRNSATLTNLKDAVDAYEAKVKAQDLTIADLQHSRTAEVEELNGRLASKDREVTELQARVAVLQDMVTGKSAIDRLTQAVDQFTTRTDERGALILSEVQSMRAEVAAALTRNT